MSTYARTVTTYQSDLGSTVLDDVCRGQRTFMEIKTELIDEKTFSQLLIASSPDKNKMRGQEQVSLAFNTSSMISSMKRHIKETNHTYAMQLHTNDVWDYAGDKYVHRLAQDKSGGKLVEVDEGGNEVQEEKLDSITQKHIDLLSTQLELQKQYLMEQISLAVKDMEAKHTRLLTTQLESQRLYLMEQISLAVKGAEGKPALTTSLHNRLHDEQMSLVQSQQHWQTKESALEAEMKELKEKLAACNEKEQQERACLENKMSEMATENVNLNQKYDQLDSRHKALQIELEDERAMNQSLRCNQDVYKASETALKGQLQELKNKLAACCEKEQQERACLENKVSEITKENFELYQEYDQLQLLLEKAYQDLGRFKAMTEEKEKLQLLLEKAYQDLGRFKAMTEEKEKLRLLLEKAYQNLQRESARNKQLETLVTSHEGRFKAMTEEKDKEIHELKSWVKKASDYIKKTMQTSTTVVPEDEKGQGSEDAEAPSN